MNITVFQALTLLADKYRKDPSQKANYEKVKHLYLSGVRSTDDKIILAELLSDPILARYVISGDKELINADPVRRYFESHLAHQTLVHSLKPLSDDLLIRHTDRVLLHIDKPTLADINERLFAQNKEHLKGFKGISREFGEIIYTYSSNSSLKDKLGERAATDVLFLNRVKIRCLAAATIGAFYAGRSRAYPADLYNEAGSVYQEKHRGRIPRVDKITGEGQTVFSNNLGIMRSYMPLSVSDTLFNEEATDYLRPADASTFIDDELPHLIPDRQFATLVTPFVNSISGTMLMQLRVIIQLVRESNFVYSDGFGKETQKRNEEQMKLFFKCLISCMVFTLGGHSFEEYTSVFKLPEIQMELRGIRGFDALTLENLFKVENEPAFAEAISKTIEYNAAILRRMEVHEELSKDSTARVSTILDAAKLKPSSKTPMTGISSSELGSALGASIAAGCGSSTVAPEDTLGSLKKHVTEVSSERTTEGITGMQRVHHFKHTLGDLKGGEGEEALKIDRKPNTT